MTKEQAIELLRFTKVYVKDKSKEIQQKAFKLGFKWMYSGADEAKMLNHLDAPFIIFYTRAMEPCRDVEYFNFDDSKEITAEEILAITIEDELKPTHRPFKNAEECWNEMLKHQPFGWVKHISTGDVLNIRRLTNLDIITTCTTKYTAALREVTFADGEPFGIKEE